MQGKGQPSSEAVELLNRKDANNDRIIRCFVKQIQSHRFQFQSHRFQMQDQTKGGRMDLLRRKKKKTNAPVMIDEANPTRNPGHSSHWAY